MQYKYDNILIDPMWRSAGWHVIGEWTMAHRDEVMRITVLEAGR